MTNPQIDQPVLKNEAEALARELADSKFDAWNSVMDSRADIMVAAVEIIFPGYHPQQAVTLRDGSVLTALPNSDQTELFFVGYHSLQDCYNSLAANINKGKH
jgi:hypothetical protein